MKKYYSFVFKGLLTEESLDKAGRRNRPIFTNSVDILLSERLGIDLIDEEIVERSKRMAIVYIAICSFENYAREFVSKKLLDVIGEDWWVKGVPEKIRQKAESRKQAEENTKWHTPRGEELINYTEFSDLTSIMRQNLPHFEPHIEKIEWADFIIRSLERSRNVIMHSGELSLPDIERVGIFIRDWIRQVGS